MGFCRLDLKFCDGKGIVCRFYGVLESFPFLCVYWGRSGELAKASARKSEKEGLLL